MKFPKFLEKNAVIGITAPSCGMGDDIPSFEKSIDTLKKEGYQIIETKSVRNKGRVSTTAKNRAKELDELVENKEVSMILCATGGDFLLEMLKYVNWQHIKENPKWFVGYSDPTSLLYYITTTLDIATIYGVNAGSFDQTNLHESLQNTLEIWKGNLIDQHSFPLYQKERKEGSDGYNLTEKVYWITSKKVKIKGRIIGGCLDCLKDILNSSYDNTKRFIEKYKEDGIIWYFDIFSKTAEETYLTLYQMKESGWFNHCKGIIVGRVCFPNCFYEDFSYEKAFTELFPNLPIIMNADIGHVPPKMTIINGAIAEIHCENGKGVIKQHL